MTLEQFKELWDNSISPTLWCEKIQHPLHRICPVILNYENLPEHYKNAISSNHEGETGDRVQADPEKCFNCEHNIRSDGICDPV